ncbi:MAG: hypothetical protein H0W44_09390 [Gammaproteobacteria bacterium]|nr:hypothetical protein [Gammaproteobacteria bacterium]
MDIDTSSLESARRNLVVLSTGFILFALGDAHLGNQEHVSTISVLASSITFKKPQVLAYFAWIMLAWFLLRFWQFSNHKNDWLSYTHSMYKSDLMGKWLKQETKDGTSAYDGDTYQPVFGLWQWQVKAGTRSAQEFFKIKPNQVFRKLTLFLYIAFKTEKFGQYYFPYFMAFFAVIAKLFF